MVSFVSTDDPTHYRAIAAGAESNVAIGMARLGCRTSWVSRVGDDPLGRLVERSVASSGVEVSLIRDHRYPTGVMVKHIAGSAKESSYYRSGSAASRLGVDDLDRLGNGRLIHVTGITSALSPSARQLVDAVVSHRRHNGARVAFDVNFRPSLWPDAGIARDVLLEQARLADVVFIGDDEADMLLGTAELSALAERILRTGEDELIVKRGAGEASVATFDGVVSIPALPAQAVDVTGAGDAFAAGYLAASCFGWPASTRLQLGHFMAAKVIARTEDVPPVLSVDELRDLSPSVLQSQWGLPVDAEGGEE
jgi:2-dehydro-3-deoxygluconokinase